MVRNLSSLGEGFGRAANELSGLLTGNESFAACGTLDVLGCDIVCHATPSSGVSMVKERCLVMDDLARKARIALDIVWLQSKLLMRQKFNGLAVKEDLQQLPESPDYMDMIDKQAVPYRRWRRIPKKK